MQHGDIDKILKARISDMVNQGVFGRFGSFYSDVAPLLAEPIGFLDPREAGVAEAELNRLREVMRGSAQPLFWGGYESAERVMLGILAEGEADVSAAKDAFGIEVLRIGYNERYCGLTHRDFLGALMSLGLERTMFGDIKCFEGYALVFCLRGAAAVIQNELKTVGRQGVRVDFEARECYNSTDNSAGPGEEETQGVLVSSMRLDALVSALLRISRSKAQDMILQGAVKLNYLVAAENDALLKVGDVFSVSGRGKFLVASACPRGKKNKIFAELTVFR